uniref:DNA-binding protein ESCAROLA n=1 Tax=Cajanus cajan TaxID=3821 RepID=A0A151T0D6_CAJCA|nr:Putative DNA-binding protein ESCAROLA [Cajanus cajan]
MFSSDTNSTVSFQCQPPPSANHSTIATSSNRNPRGRPMGSKNKPKLNIMSITEPTAMLSLIHVPQGHDVVESIMDYARREHANVTILGGSGTIARVTLHNTSGGSTALTLHGPFTLVSFTGTYVYNDRYTLNTGATPPPHMAFGISLCTALELKSLKLWRKKDRLEKEKQRIKKEAMVVKLDEELSKIKEKEKVLKEKYNKKHGNGSLSSSSKMPSLASSMCPRATTWPVESIMDFARREHVNVTILGGSGTIASVTLHHTSVRGSTTFTLHGPLALVSFTGATPPLRMAFEISLCTA